MCGLKTESKVVKKMSDAVTDFYKNNSDTDPELDLLVFNCIFSSDRVAHKGCIKASDIVKS